MKSSVKGILKGILIGIAAVVAIILMSIFCVQCSQNNAITYEEQTATSWSTIDVEQKHRIDSLYAMADCVKRYSEYEGAALRDIIAERGNDLSVKELQTYLDARHEAYPELKADKQYNTLMNEIAVRENKIAQVRNSYNDRVKEYKRYCRKFPARLFLNLCGYEVVDFKYLEYNSPADAPKSYFD